MTRRSARSAVGSVQADAVALTGRGQTALGCLFPVKQGALSAWIPGSKGFPASPKYNEFKGKHRADAEVIEQLRDYAEGLREIGDIVEAFKRRIVGGALRPGGKS